MRQTACVSPAFLLVLAGGQIADNDCADDIKYVDLTQASSADVAASLLAC